MTTEKAEDYALQGRTYKWGKLAWVDYLLGNDPKELMYMRDEWRRINSGGEWRVVHRSLEITVIDDV